MLFRPQCTMESPEGLAITASRPLPSDLGGASRSLGGATAAPWAGPATPWAGPKPLPGRGPSRSLGGAQAAPWAGPQPLPGRGRARTPNNPPAVLLLVADCIENSKDMWPKIFKHYQHIKSSLYFNNCIVMTLVQKTINDGSTSSLPSYD